MSQGSVLVNVIFNQGHKWSPKALLLSTMWIMTKCLYRRSQGDKHTNYTKEHVSSGSQVYSGSLQTAGKHNAKYLFLG